MAASTVESALHPTDGLVNACLKCVVLLLVGCVDIAYATCSHVCTQSNALYMYHQCAWDVSGCRLCQLQEP
jgi:hypothetical protein